MISYKLKPENRYFSSYWIVDKFAFTSGVFGKLIKADEYPHWTNVKVINSKLIDVLFDKGIHVERKQKE